jgi:hypothetical protein
MGLPFHAGWVCWPRRAICARDGQDTSKAVLRGLYARATSWRRLGDGAQRSAKDLALRAASKGNRGKFKTQEGVGQ